jgi:hydrogenase maturation protease
MKNSKTELPRILLIGIGNSGRGDDGLGWKFASLVSNAGYKFIDVEYRYQLQVEDSALVSEYECVIFVDASHTLLEGGFEIRSCKSAGHYYYSSHMQNPETILYLANDLYNKYPKAYTVVISGYSWDLGTTLSENAGKNLRSAFTFFVTDFLPALNHQNRVLAEF